MEKISPLHLDIGDTVDWIDPDQGVCSNQHKIIDIRTDTKRVESLDSILVLENEKGGIAEALVTEVA